MAGAALAGVVSSGICTRAVTTARATKTSRRRIDNRNMLLTATLSEDDRAREDFGDMLITWNAVLRNPGPETVFPSYLPQPS